MNLLQAGNDIAVIALWLGHEQVSPTSIYLHADMTQKERAIARTQPLSATPGRYPRPRHPPGLPRSPLNMPDLPANSASATPATQTNA